MTPSTPLARGLAGATVVAMMATTAATRAAPGEAPALSDPFVVKLGSGQRFTGAAARIDIRHTGPGQPPSIAIAFSSADPAGRQWAAQVIAPATFTQTRSLEARVSDRPLDPGDASVQGSPDADAAAVFASAGMLRLSLSAGRLDGEARGEGALLPARFAGPVAVSCSVPAAALAGPLEQPAPTSVDTPVAWVVDDQFASALCQPYATWAGKPR